MKQFELGYVVGLLEGEGCFSLRQSGPANKYRRKYASVEVQSADRDVLERLLEYLGVGTIGGPYKTREKHHAPMYSWRVSTDVAIAVMKLVLPHMSARRRDRIEEVIRDSC